MKRVLITGADSYIGTSFERYIAEHYPNDYSVDTIDMRNATWKMASFTGYDAVFHVAGIAHIKETASNAELYYRVNRDLAVETAKKAKEDGVKQFVFLSSMSVYGKDTGIITKETKPTPKSNYGKSKLQAEEEMASLDGESFKVCVLRPPMVYGNGCKGNFQTIIKIVKNFPIFPKVKNQRSMIYIENLCEFVRCCIEQNLNGLFFPQNKEYMETSVIAEIVAEHLQKKVHLSKAVGIAVVVAKPFLRLVQKAFGTLIYDCPDSMDFAYSKVEYKESIRRSL